MRVAVQTYTAASLPSRSVGRQMSWFGDCCGLFRRRHARQTGYASVAAAAAVDSSHHAKVDSQGEQPTAGVSSIWVEEYKKEGYTCGVRSSCKVNAPLHQVFGILASDAWHDVFRNIEDCKVLQRDGDPEGRGAYSVDRLVRMRWGFMKFSGGYNSHMRYEYNESERTVKVNLLKPGFVAKYSGQFLFTPLQPEGGGWRGGRAPAVTLVECDQQFKVSVLPPPPMRRLVTNLIAKQVQETMEDLVTEGAAIAARTEAMRPSAGTGRGGSTAQGGLLASLRSLATDRDRHGADWRSQGCVLPPSGSVITSSQTVVVGGVTQPVRRTAARVYYNGGRFL